MGQQASSAAAATPDLKSCLTTAVGGDANVAFPSDLLYQITDVKPYNLDIPVTPAAVTYPDSAEQVAGIVACAAQYDHKVQARSGGHSYGNYCMYPPISLPDQDNKTNSIQAWAAKIPQPSSST